MTDFRFLRTAPLCVALLLPALVHAQGKDELWEVTTKMEMAGMPMAMPAQTSKVCTPAGQSGNAQKVPQDDNCRMVESKQSGNKFTFKVVCEGKDKMTGEGEFTSGANSYTGVVRMKGMMEGERVDMTQSFSGRRVGNCNYAEQGKKAREQVAKAEAQVAQATAQACTQAVDELSPAVFTIEGLKDTCAAYKPKFCGRATQVGKEMLDPSGYSAARKRYQRQQLDDALRLCGQNPDSILRSACGASVQKRAWAFTAENCPAEAKDVSAKNCDGRAYTAAMSSEYAPVCQRYASNMTGRDYTAQPRTASDQPSTTDAIKEGAGSLLRKFLKF